MSSCFQGEQGIGKTALLTQFQTVLETAFDLPVLSLDSHSPFWIKKAMFDILDGLVEGFSFLGIKEQSSIVRCASFMLFLASFTFLLSSPLLNDSLSQ